MKKLGLILGLLLAASAFGQTNTFTNVRVTGSATINSINSAVDAGANDTYVITLAPALAAYATGATYIFKANTANTGAATLNINGLGAKTIVKATGGITTALADNDIRVGQWVVVVYDGTNMQMQSTLGNASVSAGGSDTQVQFNDGGTALGGNAGFTFNKTTNQIATTGTQITTANALGALSIDTTKGLNTKSISADSVFTFSAVPATNTWFSLYVINTDVAAHVLTIPSSFSVVLGAAITTVNIAAAGEMLLTWRHDGSVYKVFGDSPGTVSDAVYGSGWNGDTTAAPSKNAIFDTFGDQINYPLTVYGVGTAYALTNTAAAIDFGTTDPTKVIDKAGTYLIFAQVQLTYTGATVVAETATIKVRRTNNTAADVSVVVVLDLPVATTLTNTYGIFQIPPFTYTTALTNDSVSIFANVSAALGAGTIDATATGTSIVALKIY